MIDFSYICPKCCRETLDDSGYCAVCGTDAATVENEEFCIPAGSVLLDRYFIGKVIGQGGFGITYLSYDTKLKTKIALKEYFPHGFAFRKVHKEKHTVYSLSGEKTEFFVRGLEKFVTEARRLAQFSGSPGIVNVRDYFNENNTAYIVMEFVEGEPLEKLLEQKGSLTEEETINIFLPILKTLQRIHAAGILHRDIAPDNIMVEPDGTARLIDFGASAEVDETAATSAAVIKHYYAPEEQYDSNRRRQGSWTDVYAISATIFRCIEGKNLPDALERLRGVSFDGFTVPVSKPVSKAVIHGLALFAKDRAQTVDELIAAFTGTSDTEVFYKKKKKTTTVTEKSENTKNPKNYKRIAAILSGVAALAAAVCLVIFLPRTAVPVGGEIETTAVTTSAETATTAVTTQTTEVQYPDGYVSDVSYFAPGIGLGKYTGNWENNVPNGVGILKTTFGAFDGKWENGIFMERVQVGEFKYSPPYQTAAPAQTTAAQTTTAQTTESAETYVEDYQLTIYGLGTGKYTGSFKNNMPYEKGVFTYPSGSYDGEWQGGRPNGKGTFVYTGVGTYTGEVKGAKYDGQGTLELKDGTKYIGEWKNGIKNGKGKQYNPDDGRDINRKPGTFQIEEGNFVNGNLSGDYTRTKENKNGTIIEYNNTDDEQSGTYTRHVVVKNNDGSVDEFDEVFVNFEHQNNINNKHTAVEKDVKNYDWGGGKFTGHLKDGDPDGQGTIIYNDGNKYIGGWRDGQYSGKGTEYVYSDPNNPDFLPEERNGNYEDGHLVGDFTCKITFKDNTYEIRYWKAADDDGHWLGSWGSDGEVITHYEKYSADGKKTYECDEVRRNNQVIENRNEKHYE
jgi:serine/threonine protein kinase